MFIDIACNVTWENFESKFDEIYKDCLNNNIMPIFVGLDYESSLKCLLLSEKYNTCCYLGIHPNHIPEAFDTNKIKEFDYDNPRVIGVGECGLDYFRSNNVDIQKTIFNFQLSLNIDLPYFYHCRSAHSDFLELCKNNGVVHSFDGSLEEAMRVIEKGLFIGINGCSLRSNEGIEVVKQIPIENILIETDSPFCMIRKSYAASDYIKVKKDKINTPVNVIQIAQVLSIIKSIPMGELESILFNNTLRAFPKLKNFVNFWEKKGD